MAGSVDQLRKLQQLRGRREPDFSIRKLVAATDRVAGQTHRRLGKLIDLWERMVPRELAERSVITSLRRGVAQVNVDSSAVAYELDRRLRDGLLAELRAEFPGTLHRVRIRIGELDS